MLDIIRNKYFLAFIFLSLGVAEIVWNINFERIKRKRSSMFFKALEFYFEKIRFSGQRAYISAFVFFVLSYLCFSS